MPWNILHENSFSEILLSLLLLVEQRMDTKPIKLYHNCSQEIRGDMFDLFHNNILYIFNISSLLNFDLRSWKSNPKLRNFLLHPVQHGFLSSPIIVTNSCVAVSPFLLTLSAIVRRRFLVTRRHRRLSVAFVFSLQMNAYLNKYCEC